MSLQKAREQKAAKQQAIAGGRGVGEGDGEGEGGRMGEIPLEYSQEPDVAGGAGEDTSRQGRKRGRRSEGGAAGAMGTGIAPVAVLDSPCPAQGKAVHGPWCVVWSDVMSRLFFYNLQTQTGQVDVPAELVGLYGSNGAEGPGIDRLREGMMTEKRAGAGNGEGGAVDSDYVDCTLIEAQSQGEGLDLTADDLTQDLLLCASTSVAAVSDSSPIPADPLQETHQQEQHPTIVDDSPYASLDESQCSSDAGSLGLSSRRATSSYDMATALMRRMEKTTTLATGKTANPSPAHEESREGPGGAVVACPVCTYHNVQGATLCEICMGQLPAAVS